MYIKYIYIFSFYIYNKIMLTIKALERKKINKIKIYSKENLV